MTCKICGHHGDHHRYDNGTARCDQCPDGECQDGPDGERYRRRGDETTGSADRVRRVPTTSSGLAPSGWVATPAMTSEDHEAHLLEPNRWELGMRVAYCGVRHRQWEPLYHFSNPTALPLCGECKVAERGADSGIEGDQCVTGTTASF